MLTSAFIVCLLGNLNVADGTVVVLENSKPIVEAYTHSEVTHVGLLFRIGQQPWVYEATPAEVRKLSWRDYLSEIATLNQSRGDNLIRVRLYQPKRPYSVDESRRLLVFLNSQVGRRYSVRGYVRHQPGDGIHCAELVSTALGRTGRYQFPPNYSVSPASLVADIKTTHQAPLDLLPNPRIQQESCCERSWSWWTSAFHWCGWACWETWTICR